MKLGLGFISYFYIIKSLYSSSIVSFNWYQTVSSLFKLKRIREDEQLQQEQKQIKEKNIMSSFVVDYI